MKIVVLDSHPLDTGDIDWTALKVLGELELYKEAPADFAAAVRGADIVLTNKARVTAGDIPALEGCRLVGVLATGVNVVDLEALARAGIAVANVPAYGVEDVAQHALALLMELARHTALHSASVKAGDWPEKGWSYWLKPPICLAGLKLGLVGFGAIGKMMGKYGYALGMKVAAWSRSGKGEADYPFEMKSLPEILRESDVISLHCPLSGQTRNLINAENIAAMKDGAIIINTARGGLVDEDALAAALISGKIGGYGADVLSAEPPDPANPLLAAPNTLITPHMAWATRRARQKIVDITAENIRAFMAGMPANLVAAPAK